MQPPEESTETHSRFDTEQFAQRTAEYARQEPMRAVGLAFIAGLVLTLLPIGGIAAGLARLAAALLRPALLILGAVKVYDEIQKRNR